MVNGMLATVDRPRARAWARDELMRLIEIPSYSGREHEIVDHLERRLRALGLPAHRQPVPGAAENLLVAWDEHPRLLLTAHVDTIEPTWEWNGSAELRGRVVHGLGAQDDKGCVVACFGRSS
jgi:acetylornithine deacetylase/succinyl-diaminopimelate desuccinylase-like protein